MQVSSDLRRPSIAVWPVVAVLTAVISGVAFNSGAAIACGDQTAPVAAPYETPDMAAWQKYQYTDLRSRDFDVAWSKLKVEEGSTISPPEFTKLVVDSAAYLKIFASDNAPDQLIQRIDKSGLKMSAGEIEEFKQQAKSGGVTLSEDTPLGVIRLIYGSILGRQLIGVSVPNSSVRILHATKSSNPAPEFGLHIVMVNGIHVEGWGSSFSHKYNYRTAYDSGKTVTLADLKFYANEAGKTPVGQLYAIRFWRDDQSGEWVPIAATGTETSEDSTVAIFVP